MILRFFLVFLHVLNNNGVVEILVYYIELYCFI